MCERLRGETGRSELERFADLVNDNTNRLDVNVLSVRRNGDRATVEFTAHKPGEPDLKVKVHLVHEQGDWKPCGASSGRIAS